MPFVSSCLAHLIAPLLCSAVFLTLNVIPVIVLIFDNTGGKEDFGTFVKDTDLGRVLCGVCAGHTDCFVMWCFVCSTLVL